MIFNFLLVAFFFDILRAAAFENYLKELCPSLSPTYIREATASFAENNSESSKSFQKLSSHMEPSKRFEFARICDALFSVQMNDFRTAIVSKNLPFSILLIINQMKKFVMENEFLVTEDNFECDATRNEEIYQAFDSMVFLTRRLLLIEKNEVPQEILIQNLTEQWKRTKSLVELRCITDLGGIFLRMTKSQKFKLQDALLPPPEELKNANQIAWNKWLSFSNVCFDKGYSIYDDGLCAKMNAQELFLLSQEMLNSRFLCINDFMQAVYLCDYFNALHYFGNRIPNLLKIKSNLSYCLAFTMDGTKIFMSLSQASKKEHEYSKYMSKFY